MSNVIEEAVLALKAALGIGENLTDPKQFDIKKMKRLQYQLEAAQQYIFVDERCGEYKDLSDAKQKEFKIHYRRQAFDSY